MGRDGKLCLMRFGAIGEAVTLLPALHNLTRDVPEERIVLLAEDVVHRIVERDFPGIDHLSADEVYSGRGVSSLLFLGFLRELTDLLGQLRAYQFESFLCFHTYLTCTNALKPHFFHRMIRHESSYGIDAPYFPKWDVSIPYRKKEFDHVYRKNLRLVEKYGASRGKDGPWIGVEDARLRTVRERFQRQFGVDPREEEVVMVCPGAADPWRCWPPEKYRQLLGDLSSEVPATFVFTGKGNIEKEIIEKVADGLPSDRVIDASNFVSVTNLPELIDMADVFLSNDTGPMHIAVAREVPTVGLFGPGVVYHWASYDVPHFTPVYVDVPSDPILESFRDDPAILQRIPVEDVRKAFLDQYGSVQK